MNSTDIARLVLEARSCRRFVEAERIPAEFLLELVDVARVCPSSRNQQALRFMVFSSETECARVFPFMKWAAALDWKGPQPGERATGYILFIKPTGVQTAHDSGIVGMAMKLTAAAEGWASVMLGGLDRAGLHRELCLPADMEIDIAIAFGRPGEVVVIEPLKSGAPVAYWHGNDSAHHVPKLSLGDLLYPARNQD